MEIDLGVLGIVKVEEFDEGYYVDDKEVLYDGHTVDGIRVHVVEGRGNPRVWRNAIIIYKEGV
ncbi:MAG: hypothetical protein P3W91_002940 [Fervidobacterium sp.]|nr:hypothetical protein [Fervidobacterium sp.]